MRLSLLAALLSTVLMPVAANAQRHDRGDHDRGHRNARVERPARPAAAPRPAHRAEHRAAPARVARPDRQHRTTRPIQRVDPNRFRQDHRTTAQHRPDRVRTGTHQQRTDRNDRDHRWNRGDRNDREHQWNRRDRNDRDHQWNRGDRNDRDRWNRERRERQHRWDRSGADWNDHYRNSDRFHDRVEFNRRWRDDRRYNWRDWRTRNRSTYHLPRYYAPHGWSYGYRRFSIGFRLNSLLFGSGYWINDPYYYRLPPAYGPYRWVRYYDDALLVDIRTGVVVDVVYDIFW
ncbi:MAG TPA: RcnB family protein [Sphingomonas sp.]|nr:RcnB family protein [Sphingomonas sp.]